MLGAGAVLEERRKVETPTLRAQREALLGWNPRGRFEMASPTKDSL